MLREFGGGLEFERGTPKKVIETALGYSFREAVKDLPELDGLEYEIIAGPMSPRGDRQAWGWYLNFESDKEPTSSIYELTQQLRAIEDAFKSVVGGILDGSAEGRCQLCGFVGQSHFCVGAPPVDGWKYASTDTST
jgi:hypothetical protein